MFKKSKKQYRKLQSLMLSEGILINETLRVMDLINICVLKIKNKKLPSLKLLESLYQQYTTYF